MAETDLERVDIRLRQRLRTGWQLVERTDEPPTALIRAEHHVTHAMPGPVVARRTGDRYIYRLVQIMPDGQVDDPQVPAPTVA